MSETHRMPETPAEALGPVALESVIIDEHTFVMARPTDTDKLLDNATIRAAFEADEYMPYWVELWPAARMLAKVVVREPWVHPPDGKLHALEIGCGLGLPGVAALAKGLRVTFSDYDATALRFAADNARRNGFEEFEVLQLDWRHPPAELRVPVLLAADLIYEIRNVAPLVGLIKQILAPDGVCLLTDQDRVPSHVLREELTRSGMQFTTQVARAGEPGGRRIKGTLYRIRHGQVRS